MTHDELLEKIRLKFFVNEEGATQSGFQESQLREALRAVVELHKSNQIQEAVWCTECSKRFENSGWYEVYPCPTIQAIEKQLK
jgi:hypothetical protein